MADRDIPEEMVEKVAQHCWHIDAEQFADFPLSDWEKVTEPFRERFYIAARRILSAALAGRQVVDLPEPDESPERRGHIADWCPATWEVVAHLDINGDPLVDDDDRMLTADSAERHGLAMIAAAHAARRYADEHRAAGSGSGED